MIKELIEEITKIKEHLEVHAKQEAYVPYIIETLRKTIVELKYVSQLRKENTELKGEANNILDNWCRGEDPCPHLKKRDEQLAKAKEYIKLLLKNCVGIYESTGKTIAGLQAEAKQFLRDLDKSSEEIQYDLHCQCPDSFCENCSKDCGIKKLGLVEVKK